MNEWKQETLSTCFSSMWLSTLKCTGPFQKLYWTFLNLICLLLKKISKSSLFLLCWQCALGGPLSEMGSVKSTALWKPVTWAVLPEQRPVAPGSGLHCSVFQPPVGPWKEIWMWEAQSIKWWAFRTEITLGTWQCSVPGKRGVVQGLPHQGHSLQPIVSVPSKSFSPLSIKCALSTFRSLRIQREVWWD
jgi:hypothetical protein